MNNRKTNKNELDKVFEDPIIYQDALKIVEHLIASDIEALSYKLQKMNVNSNGVGVLKHTFHRDQVADIKLKYYEPGKSDVNQSRRYHYLDSITNDLLNEKNKNITTDPSVAKEKLYHLRQKYRLRVYRLYLKNVLNVILKSNSNQNLPNNIKKLFLVNFALTQDLQFNLLAEEKRFLSNALLEQRMRSRNTDELYQSNIFQTQTDQKVSLYNEQYAMPFGEFNEEGLISHFLSDIETMQTISSNFVYDQDEVLQTHQDLRQFYDKYKNALDRKKLAIFNVESENDIDTQVLIRLSSETLAKGNLIAAWQKWLDERDHKNEKSVLQPLVLMQSVKSVILKETTDVRCGSDYLNKLIKMVDEVLAKNQLNNLKNNIEIHARKLVTSTGSRVNNFLDKHWKTLAFIAGGVAMGLLAISLCACTGGLSMLAFGIVHLVHVAPVVAKLLCVVSAVAVGGGVGYGGKRAADCCTDAGHEADDCAKDDKADAIPVVYRSEIKTPGVGAFVEQVAASTPNQLVETANSSVPGLRH